jgi:hypothetical protein
MTSSAHTICLFDELWGCAVAYALTVSGGLSAVGCGAAAAGDIIKDFVGGIGWAWHWRSHQWSSEISMAMQKYGSFPFILYEGFIERFKQIINWDWQFH